MKVWRLGHKKAPCDYVPLHLCSWQNRFDDPERRYRTLYCAEHRMTCLREVLADLRPNAKAMEDFASLFGSLAEGGLTVAGVVSTKWRKTHVLTRAKVNFLQGTLADLGDASVRRHLTREHGHLLRQHGLQKLDLGAIRIRSKNRRITQAISRSLFNKGNAGVRFLSHLDKLPCFALFEGRATLAVLGTPVSMTEDVEELVRVCGDYTLVLRPA